MMNIGRIYVNNFKSFNEIDIDLKKINLVIGANASGKSNFIQIIKFYHDAIAYGLENAISLQGGTQYLRNTNLKENYKSLFKFELNFERKIIRKINSDKSIIEIKNILNEFHLSYNKRGDGFSIAYEKIIIHFNEYSNNHKSNNLYDNKVGEFYIKLERIKGKKNIKIELVSENGNEYDVKEILPPIDLLEDLIEKDELMINYIALFIGLRNFFNENFAIFDLDPKVLKKSSSVSAKYRLEEDGSNLSICLNKVLKSPKTKKMFLGQLRDMLPFINGILTEKTLDKTMLFKIKEKYNNSRYFPAALMSDGTVNIVAMILALYFDNRNLVVFEEPERNIHPGLLSNVIEKFYEVSTKKQILVTTHNPQLIKHVKIDDMIFIKRNEFGFTEGKRVNDIEDIGNFLDEEIGIDELYIDDIIGGLF